MKQLINYRRNVFSHGLQVRYESSTPKETVVQAEPSLEPIPEPPVPLADVTESAVQVFEERN